MSDQTPEMLRLVALWVKDNQAIHTVIGLVGSTTFFVGSILFISDTTVLAGTILFIIGSLFMLVGSVGDAIVKREKWGKDSEPADS